MKRICWNPNAELLREDKLARIRLKKIKFMLDLVYRGSPFYRRKFKKFKVKPNDITSLDDFAKKIPLTRKEEIRYVQAHDPPFGDNICVPYSRVKWLVASTGTTGKPTYTGATRNDWRMWMESLKRSFWLTGFRPKDVLLHALALGPWISGITYTQAAREFGMTVMPAGVPTPAKRMLTFARDSGVNSMVCTPSYAEHLAEKVRELLSIEPCDFGLRKLGCSGEPGAGIHSIRRRIETLWDCDCRDRMGTPEQIPGNRAECFIKNGMHLVTPDFTYDEFIDPDTLEKIEPNEGVEGELVYTSLEKECNPLIRFCSNDRAEIRALSCECGYPGPTITIIGRFDDMLKIRGVKVWPSAIKSILSEMIPKVTGEFRIILEREPVAFSVRGPVKLMVEHGKGITKDRLEEIREEIRSRIRDSLYFTPNEVELFPPGFLKSSQFKRKYIEIEPLEDKA